MTDKRLFLVHKSGLITKREIPLVDIGINEISYCKVEGSLRKVLIIGVKASGGQIIAYKIHVPNPESWSAQIFASKGGSTFSQNSSPTLQPAPQPSTQVPGGPAIYGDPTLEKGTRKFCTHCGRQVNNSIKYCPSCGTLLNYDV